MKGSSAVVTLVSMLASSVSGMALLAPGAKVAVVGGGAVQILSARLAALRGFETTIALPETEMATAKRLMFDDAHPEGSLPLKCLSITGESASSEDIEACVAGMEGLIIAFDNEGAFMPPSALKIFTDGSNLKHISLMSRTLNGGGMGFFPNAAKMAANAEIWAGTDALVAQFKKQDAEIRARASEIGASCTIIRAGTLKGGASADAAIDDGNGEADFLNPYFYTMGQQDVVNWRLLFDCSALGVEMMKGDTMQGPGFQAAMTATSLGAGDSHRGAVASALVEAMRVQAAQDGGDFSVASVKGEAFPEPDAFAKMFASA